jgi:hypothetical protein
MINFAKLKTHENTNKTQFALNIKQNSNNQLINTC